MSYPVVASSVSVSFLSDLREDGEDGDRRRTWTEDGSRQALQPNGLVILKVHVLLPAEVAVTRPHLAFIPHSEISLYTL